jgi:hypothetical protein
VSGGLLGGAKLKARLKEIEERLSKASSVKVGFLAGSTYPDGTSIPMVAATQEFGGTINREAHDQTLYRQVNAAGKAFLKNGRFVKKSKSNKATTHAVGAYSITIPPRPFFRNMIQENKSHWGDDMAKILKSTDYDTVRSLALMGNQIAGELQQSIHDTNSPPLAASTIRAKSKGGVKKIEGVLGPAKPLIDSGTMWNSVDFEVKE